MAVLQRRNFAFVRAGILIVSPVAGVLYAAVLNLYRLFTKNRED